MSNVANFASCLNSVYNDQLSSAVALLVEAVSKIEKAKVYQQFIGLCD